MAKTPDSKTLAVALGTTFAVSLAAAPLAGAAENPFAATQFERGYMVAGDEGKCGSKDESEGKCGSKGEDEGKCGGDKGAEGKCGG